MTLVASKRHIVEERVNLDGICLCLSLPADAKVMFVSVHSLSATL
jgi:hypothetical protein